jgi:protocatechuate 3,4-dioxygenase alpha subunit
MSLTPTPSQTVGPYLHIGLSWLTTTQVAAPDCPGEHVTIRGRVLDGDGKPIPDGMVEIWQADAHGKYAHPEDTQDKPGTPGFRGFGRVPTGADGEFQFDTIKPGPVPDPQGGWQAPHILVSVFMRGLLIRAVTRMYFPDEPANATDRILQAVPAERRGTLVARRQGAGELLWDIHMQGPEETVFFDC